MCLMRIDSPKKPKFRPSVTIHFPEACSFKKTQFTSQKLDLTPLIDEKGIFIITQLKLKRGREFDSIRCLLLKNVKGFVHNYS